MSDYKSDIEIAREANKVPIIELANNQLELKDERI